RFEFTNVVCESFDKKFAEFEPCFLKSVNRTYKYLSATMKLHQLPVTDVKSSFAIWKRFNGYKPFLYNVSLDFCKFLKNRKSMPVANYFFESVRDYTNLNHSCPFNHDFTLDKLSVNNMNQRMSEVLPFPHGDYMFEIIWYRGKFHRLVAKIYFTL
ncbi:hypothetical protein KR009_011447, partial [Drosophila setifemur]